MGYITNSDIEERLGASTYVQLSDDNGDGVADTPVVDEARLGAEGEVNCYLAARVQVPVNLLVFPELAGVLVSITLDLAEFRLRCRRPPMPQEAIGKHDAAVEWLRGVAEGGVKLPSAAEMPGNTAAGLIAATRGEGRMLSREELSDF